MRLELAAINGFDGGKMTETAKYTADNRAAWDASAPLHHTGAYWDELCLGFASKTYSRFDATMTNTLIDAGIKDARVVQIGCNNGRELLSACALGANYGLGIDQSGAFLEQAAHLQRLSGHNASFLNADIYALPSDTPRDFDIAFITIGVLSWMPDLPGFFAVLASLLRPGGRMVIYETHPILEMFDPHGDTPDTPTIPYFHTGPDSAAEAITYDGTRAEAPISHWFIHTMGDIITAAISAGITITALTEFPHSIREVDYARYENQAAQLPMSYMLLGTKP